MEKVSQNGDAVDYIIPKSWVKINPTRQLSAEQRAAMCERARERLLRRNAQVIAGTASCEASGADKNTSETAEGEKPQIAPIIL